MVKRLEHVFRCITAYAERCVTIWRRAVMLCKTAFPGQVEERKKNEYNVVEVSCILESVSG